MPINRSNIVYLVLLITAPLFAQNQFRLNKIKSFNVGVVVDPNASIKEKGLNRGIEVEYVKQIYTRISYTSFPTLTYGYTDLTGASGVNFTSGRHNRIRYYTGGRFGYIQRSTTKYPTVGLEAGIDYKINSFLLVGVRATNDKRNDFKIYRTTPEMRQSGFIKVGLTL